MQTNKSPKIVSLIIPVFNEEESLPSLLERLDLVCEKVKGKVEWLFINDGSNDKTFEILVRESIKDKRIKVLSFSRNFGHQAAITAGIQFTEGDVAIIMDADLQDPPELIYEMLEKFQQGYDIVYAQRRKRAGETVFKRFTAWAFYRLIRFFSGVNMPVDTGDFRLISRKVLEVMKSMGESQRFLRGLISWTGFNQCPVFFDRQERKFGTTKFSMKKMVTLAADAIFSFSILPLRLSTFFGLLVFTFGFAYGFVQMVRYFYNPEFVRGWASLVVLGCAIGGAILVCLGMIGEYVGRIYQEVKHRPHFVVDRTVNLDVKDSKNRLAA